MCAQRELVREIQNDIPNKAFQWMLVYKYNTLNTAHFTE